MTIEGDDLPTGFRLTRGGRIFSPWVSEVGLPIYAPPDFDLEECYQAAHAKFLSTTSDHDDLAVATPPPSPLVSCATAALDDLDSCQALDALPDSVGLYPPFPPLPPPETDAKTKAKKSSHERRRAKRLAKADAAGRGRTKPVKASAVKRWKNAVPMELVPEDPQCIADALAHDDSHIHPASGEPIHTDMSLDMEDVRVASSTFVGERLEQTADDVRPKSAEEWLERGFDYVKWDGRTCHPILTRTGEVLAALGGCPMDDNWHEVNEQLIPIFSFLEENYRFSKGQREHRRGDFKAVACGISYGGGQQRVSNLAQTPHNQAVLDIVLRKRAVHRVANFGASVMRVLNPRMYDMYESCMCELCERDAGLRRNFPGNPFAAATFNVGKNTVAYGHTDHLNVPVGWCAITAVGDYDPTLGGHLVLSDLKLVIEFPPGSTILIPSALLKHSNTRLHNPGKEFRHSFVQYSAGGLFRWVACGHQTQKAFMRAGGRFTQTGKERWMEGVKVFSKWSEVFPGETA